MTPHEETFGELVARLRTRAGLNQDDFASAVGVDRKTLSRIENSGDAPKLKDEQGIVRKMAEVLKVQTSVLSAKLSRPWVPLEEAQQRTGMKAIGGRDFDHLTEDDIADIQAVADRLNKARGG